MTRYIAQRLLGMIPTLLLLVMAVVLFARFADTDVIDVLLAEQATDKTTRKDLEARLGIDKSLPETYIDYVSGLPRGDLGTSLLNGREVRELIFDRINITLELAFFAIIIGWAIGALVGVISAIAQDGPLDYILRGFAILGLTIPTFAVGTAVVLLPAIYWQWSPPLVYHRFTEDPIAHLSQFIAPSLVLAFALMGPTMRLMRTQMLEVLRQDYIRTARVKGLKERRVITGHALKNAMIPVISLFGLQIATAMSGSVIMETIFGLPGLGRLLIENVNSKDWPVVQGVTLVVGIWVMLVNLLIDLSYGLFDPRVKVGGRAG